MRYIIGIDLGTTNSAVAFIDTKQPYSSIQFFSIPQFTSLGRIDYKPTLPSFCYLVGQNEWPKGVLSLPWKEEEVSFVGYFAKNHGSKVPSRLIQSAKSWLSHVGANRKDKILPVEAQDLSIRMSPVEASSTYLIHLRDAWNAIKAKGDVEAEFEDQEIILTVPASFDEVARSLTVEAARQAGLNHLILLEEPQAAFYSWISLHEKEWQTKFQPGEVILVCDVGGGTTDFSLIDVGDHEGKLRFQRMAVGNHLLLGGDNMDAALAYFLESKLKEEGLPPLENHQWLQLLAEARQAKEALLHPEASDDAIYTVVLQGSGSSVVGGSTSFSVEKKDVEQFLLNGFFGVYPKDEALKLKPTRGIRTMGLPYEDEPSITKQLAHFLNQSGHFKEPSRIDYLLFNGGAFKPNSFKEAIRESLKQWYEGRGPQILETSSLDLAVARGAAYYGKARKGEGVSIRGGTPRTYYIEVEVKDEAGGNVPKALTIVPRGSEEGMSFYSSHFFSLRANQPVVFHILTSHVRLHDGVNDLIAIDPSEMHLLPPIQTILRFGKTKSEDSSPIPVRLGVKLTPLGTLEIWLESKDTQHRWNLEFQLRSVSGQDVNTQQILKQQDETFTKEYFDDVKLLMDRFFLHAVGSVKSNRLMESLEEILGMSRRDWPPTVLRALADHLFKISDKRKLTAEHELRWWNLMGFLLRPGYGYPLDDHRVKELWKIVLAELKNPKSLELESQMAICLRRISGGLNKGQQSQVGSQFLNQVMSKRSGKIEIKHRSEEYPYSERIRVLAAFERLDLQIKIQLGEALIERIISDKGEHYDFWALGRIGARHLVYGSAGQVIPKNICTKWVEALLLKMDDKKADVAFALKQLCRKTDHRELNLSEDLVGRVREQLSDENFGNEVDGKDELSSSELEMVLGDRLPPGLVLETNKL